MYAVLLVRWASDVAADVACVWAGACAASGAAAVECGGEPRTCRSYLVITRCCINLCRHPSSGYGLRRESGRTGLVYEPGPGSV